MVQNEQLLAELLRLPVAERLELAKILMNSTASSDSNGDARATLMSLVGRYVGGEGDTSENDEAIFESEVDPVTGLSVP